MKRWDSVSACEGLWEGLQDVLSGKDDKPGKYDLNTSVYGFLSVVNTTYFACVYWTAVEITISVRDILL